MYVTQIRQNAVLEALLAQPEIEASQRDITYKCVDVYCRKWPLLLST